MSLNKVTERVIEANALTNVQIANSAITSRHISIGAVSAQHLASSINVTSVSSNVNIINDNVTALQDNLNSYASTTNSSINTTSSNVLNVNTNVAAVLSNQIAIATFTNGNVNSVQGNLSGLISGGTAFSSSKTFEQSVTIEGDLTVIGNSSVVGANNLTINDSIIGLANNQTGAPTVDGGVHINRGSSANAAVYWDESDDVWVVGFTNTPSNAAVLVGTNDTVGLRVGKLDARIINTGNASMATQANINSITDNVNTVSSNVANGLRPHTNAETSSGSNVFGIGSSSTPTNSSNISVYADGVYQPSPSEWVFHSGNNSIQFKDSSFPSNIVIDIQAWHI